MFVDKTSQVKPSLEKKEEEEEEEFLKDFIAFKASSTQKSPTVLSSKKTNVSSFTKQVQSVQEEDDDDLEELLIKPLKIQSSDRLFDIGSKLAQEFRLPTSSASKVCLIEPKITTSANKQQTSRYDEGISF
jgi:hypothetical protein